jgi:hypothetical protein
MKNAFVVAPLAARLDVARMHDEVDVIVPIDLGNQSRERCLPDGAVRHVADQGEREGCHTASPVRRLLGSNRPVHDDKAQQDDNARDHPFHGDSLRWVSNRSSQ